MPGASTAGGSAGSTIATIVEPVVEPWVAVTIGAVGARGAERARGSCRPGPGSTSGGSKMMFASLTGSIAMVDAVVGRVGGVNGPAAAVARWSPPRTASCRRQRVGGVARAVDDRRVPDETVVADDAVLRAAHAPARSARSPLPASTRGDVRWPPVGDDDAVRRRSRRVLRTDPAAARGESGRGGDGEREDDATHGCDSRKHGKRRRPSREVAAGRSDRSVSPRSVPLARPSAAVRWRDRDGQLERRVAALAQRRREGQRPGALGRRSAAR